MTIKSMSAHTGDGTLRSPQQCLEECLEDIGKRGAFKDGKKLLVLCVDDTKGDYSISFAQAGMKMSECVTLCEISKSIFF